MLIMLAYDKIRDIAEVGLVNLSGIAVSLNIGFVLDWFHLANDFFVSTEAVWKAIPIILTSIYTLKKIFKDEKPKSNGNDD